MKSAVEQVFNGSIPQVAIGSAYDPLKINRGKHTGQFNLGSGLSDKFIGPAPLGVGNLAETSLAIPSAFIHPVKIVNDLFWVFGSDVATAGATRRVQLWTYVPSTATYTFVGAVTLTLPTATAHTVRGLRAVLTNYSTGTVSVSGASVTGLGSSWLTGLSVGSRIGFGSIDPNQISTWFQISNISNDTSLTLTANAGSFPAGTPYVIQDLMIVQATTNATVTNGGIFVTKGLRFEDFTNPATTIPAATTVDKIKAVYWLRDAATVTTTIAGGCALGDLDSLTQQYAYVPHNTASVAIHRYNIRAPLTLVAGGATLTGSDILITGSQAVPGTLSQVNNGRVATLQHGPGSGVPSLYLLTTTRVLRAPLSSITAGNTSWLADSMSEVPTGGVSTNLSSGSSPFAAFDIATSIDKIVIAVGGAVPTGALYVTDYNTGGLQLDRRASCATGQVPSSLRDLDSPIHIHYITSSVPSLWVEDGWLFWVYSTGSTTTLNAFTAYPLAADIDFEADVPNRIICPKMSLGSIPSKLYRVAVNAVQNLGSIALGVAPDMFKTHVRTSGIDTNTGVWVDVPPNGDLSGLDANGDIQFSFTFRTVGTVMLPARIQSLALIYETEDSLPSQYRWNFGDFNQTSGTFAFKQAELFNIAVPLHTINIYRADTNALVLTQTSAETTNGTFEYFNGSTWVVGLGLDIIGTRRRFVPTGSLPGGVDLYAKLTVA
jgi:hypothetical protein